MNAGDVLQEGTIGERPRKDGSVDHMARISIMCDGEFVHRDHKTVDRRSAANAWLEQRKAELAEPGGLGAARRCGHSGSELMPSAESLDSFGRVSREDEPERASAGRVATIMKFGLGEFHELGIT